MGIVSKIKDMEAQFKSTKCASEKQQILKNLKEFSVMEQGLEDVPRQTVEQIWEKAKQEEFYDTFYTVGVLGRKYKEEGSFN